VTNEWFKRAWRRNVIDMHITEDDPRFLTEFDAKKYVELLALSGAQSAVVYAHSHTGLCNYPTKVGRMHKNLKGRDIFGEVLEYCRQKGLFVQAYYSLIFNTWAYREFPDWRIRNDRGEGVADKRRYGVCCPNSPYRDHMVRQVEELCTNYDFDGIRFDMTFWPAPVCYCKHCRKRYATEVGGKMPTVIDWQDPKWVALQRKREAWLVEFAGLATGTVRRLKPEATVEHQASGYFQGWRFGVSADLVEHNDFLQGDFYGGTLEGTFVCKLLSNLTPNKPFGFETSATLHLSDHTTLKTSDLIRAKSCRAMANGGAFIFIDAIDPVGTLNKKAYSTIGKIFTEMSVYDPWLGGVPAADVAIYLSTESKFEPADNGKRYDDPKTSWKTPPHLAAALNAAQACVEANIPYTVITRKNLADLGKYNVVVLPNVFMMNATEVEAFRNFVKAGGNLYASKFTSRYSSDGKRTKDVLLSDVLGVSHIGETKESFTYIAPAKSAQRLFGDYSLKYPMSIQSSQIKIKAHRGAKVLGEMVLPYTDPADPIRFASIHSNPPGDPAGYPSIVEHRFGKGKTIYVAGDLEAMESHRRIFVNLIRRLASRPFAFESDAPTPVEITRIDQPEHNRTLIHVLNFQNEMPNLPVCDVTVRVLAGKKTVKRLTLAPKGTAVAFRKKKGYVEFTLPKLETYALYELSYE